MRTRSVVLVVLAAGLLLLVIVAGLRVSRTESPAAIPSPAGSPTALPSASLTASPTATATAASPSPTPGPLAHGYVMPGPPLGHLSIRAETDGRVVRELTGLHHAAVSPDGGTLAYWKTGPGGEVPHTLTLHAVATGAERSLHVAAAGQRGAGIAWASDSRGLLFVVETPQAPGGPPSGPARSELWYDLTATQVPARTSSDVTLTGGFVILPVAWDGPGQLATAVLTGEGGFAIDYLIWDLRSGGVRRIAIPQAWQPIIADRVGASSDGTYLLAPAMDGTVLHIWPVADIDAAGEVRPAPGAAPQVAPTAQWRPGSPRDVAWTVGGNVELFTYQSGSSRTIYRATGTPITIVTWRADGSGLVIYESQARRNVLVEVASGRATPLAWVPDGWTPIGAVILR